MLFGTLGASLLGNILAGKWVIAMSQGQGVNTAGEGAIVKNIRKQTKWKRQCRGIVRAGSGNKKVQKTTTKNENNFQCCLILYLILKYRNIIKIKLDLMVFILEINYPK